jgi:peptidoglycan/LPS O-acetylase OafA/YrhL
MRTASPSAAWPRSRTESSATASSSRCRAGHVGNAEALLPLVEAIAVACAIYITIGRRSGLIFALLNQRAVIWLGVLSYSLYVWQELFIAWSAGPRLSPLALYDWRLWWIAAFGSACASYYLVERPILRIRDKYRRVGVRAPAPEAVFRSRR